MSAVAVVFYEDGTHDMAPVEKGGIAFDLTLPENKIISRIFVAPNKSNAEIAASVLNFKVKDQD